MYNRKVDPLLVFAILLLLVVVVGGYDNDGYGVKTEGRPRRAITQGPPIPEAGKSSSYEPKKELPTQSTVLKQELYVVPYNFHRSVPILSVTVATKPVTSCDDIGIEDPLKCFVLPAIKRDSLVVSRITPTCTTIAYTNNAATHRDPSRPYQEEMGSFRAEVSPLCPQKCQFRLQWKTPEGKSQSTNVTLQIVSDQPWWCPPSLLITHARGVYHGCGRPSQERKRCGAYPEIPPLLSVEGKDKDQISITVDKDRPLVFLRQNADPSKITDAFLVVRNRFHKRIETKIRIGAEKGTDDYDGDNYDSDDSSYDNQTSYGTTEYPSRTTDGTTKGYNSVTINASASWSTDGHIGSVTAKVRPGYETDASLNDTGCPESKDENNNPWPPTPSRVKVQGPFCPSGYQGLVTRRCSATGDWRQPSYLGCSREELANVSSMVIQMTEGSIPTTSDLVESVTGQVSTSINTRRPRLSGDLRHTIRIMRRLSQAVNTQTDAHTETPTKMVVSRKSLENLASAANGLLSSDTDLWENLQEEEDEELDDDDGDDEDDDNGQNSNNDLLAAMDSLVKSSLSDPDLNGSQPIVLENVIITRDRVKAVDDIRFPEPKNIGLYKGSQSWDDGGDIGTNSSMGVKVFLPASSFRHYNKDVEYGVILYKKKDKRFVVSRRNRNFIDSESHEISTFQIASTILSFSTNIESEKLKSELQLEFYVKSSRGGDDNKTETEMSSGGDHQFHCAYLDTDTQTAMAWTGRHCRTETDVNGRVRCFCRHLTNFAVLMSPVRGDVHHKALSIISLLGCVVSIICLVVTLIMYAALWNTIKSSRTLLHVCLCVSLLVAYVVFLAGVERTDHPTGCLVITVLLHYFLLVAFSVMLTEGIELYIRVKFVFVRKDLGWKLILPPFIFPLVIVALTLGVTWESGHYVSRDFCWLDVEHGGALWSFLGPVIFVLVGNVMIAFLVIRIMLSTRAMVNQQNKNKLKATLKAVCVITPVLGFTWILGLFVIHHHPDDDNVPDRAGFFHYAFAVANSLQGLLIFIFHCLLAKQIRDALKVKVRVLRSRYQNSYAPTGMTSTGTGQQRLQNSMGDDLELNDSETRVK